MNAARFYVFRASNGSTVQMRRGMGAAKMTGGGGGWDTVARPRRVGYTRWTGRDPFTMDVPFLFDGYADGVSVEQDIARLNQMQISPGALIPPPTIQIDGALPVKGATWVIDNIDWGDIVIWSASGNSGFRYRQDGVVHLKQYIPIKFVKLGSPQLGVSGTYVVKNGDTLKSIAKYWYGDVSKVKLIQQANNIRDSKSIKVGDPLRMPISNVPVVNHTGIGKRALQ